MRKISLGQTFVLFHGMADGDGKDGACICFKVMKILISEDGFEEIRKIGTVLEVKVTYHLFRYGLDIRV